MAFTAAAALITSVYALPSSKAPAAKSGGGIPAIPGMKVAWSDDFSSGKLDTNKWQVITGTSQNEEQEVYGRDDCNVSGNSLKILPRKGSDGKWTSCRIETYHSWAPKHGGSVTFASRIKLGSGSVDQMKGVWPAFWALGQSMRDTPKIDWPECGEIDTMENVSGESVLHGTLHCGPKCNDNGPAGNNGLTAQTDIDRSQFITYSHTVSADKIELFKDGTSYKSINKDDIGESWETFTKPFYIILNVAMGGSWPGVTDDATAQGAPVGMEVEYVAVYESTEVDYRDQ
ncbi:family 16 glycoside hydrolase [Calycina marina]|uniref:Family 16 glycoside hydrolase n=1 Tax=Calycina marina TaxID=1763456 RepID=A0A9P7ZAG5_9HELO|nr:family 16 glycoside hydrolase [Calycina marina]